MTLAEFKASAPTTVEVAASATHDITVGLPAGNHRFVIVDLPGAFKGISYAPAEGETKGEKILSVTIAVLPKNDDEEVTNYTVGYDKLFRAAGIASKDAHLKALQERWVFSGKFCITTVTDEKGVTTKKKSWEKLTYKKESL